jgi:uncharacterized protein
VSSIRFALTALIRAYQRTLSPLLGDCCRFEPSCSRYCQLCVEHHGALRGSWLGLLRIVRCNPFFAGGYDPPLLPPHVDPKLCEPNWQRVSDWVDQAVPPAAPRATHVHHS